MQGRFQKRKIQRELAEVASAIEEVEARQRRLVRPFTEGDIPHELLREQRTTLSRERQKRDRRRQALEAQKSTTPKPSDLESRMSSALTAIQQWTAWGSIR
jgi:hypothetical protein